MAGWLRPVGFFYNFVAIFSITFYYVKPYRLWPPGASGRVRGFGWSVCIKKCTSGSSGVDWCVVAAARRQNLVRRASGAPPEVAFAGAGCALVMLHRGNSIASFLLLCLLMEPCTNRTLRSHRSMMIVSRLCSSAGRCMSDRRFQANDGPQMLN